MSKTMNYCSNCSQALERDDKFCAACGEQVEIMSAAENVKPTKGKRVLLDDLVALRQLIEGAAELTKGPIDLFFGLVRDKFKDGELSLDDYKKVTDGLLFKDGDGKRWSVGAKSGDWYRRNGSSWVVKEPDVMLELHYEMKAAVIKTKVFCRRCGVTLRSEAIYCKQCGASRK